MLKKAKVTKNEKFTSDVFELTFKMEEQFNYASGQFTTIKINDGIIPPCFRAYSISSAPSQNPEQFQTCVKIVEGGRGSGWLSKLEEGDEIEFMGPSGKFLFQTPGEKTAVFIATGTGITPFISMINEELKKGTNQKFHLLFGLRHIRNVFYKEQLDELAEKYSNFTFDITLSRPEDDSWTGKTGRVTDHLEALDPQTTEVYICGLKDMINAVQEQLKGLGFNEENVHFEKFD